MGLVLGGRRPVVLTGHADASWADDQATQRSSQGYTFSLGSGSVSWRSTRSSSVLRSSCEAEIYAGAMAAQELRWLTYLLTDLGEQPHSPPVLLWGDFVIHPELALLCLTGLVTSCCPPLCLWGFSYLYPTHFLVHSFLFLHTDHLSYECPDRDVSDEDDTKGGRSRSTSRRPHRDARQRKEKQTSRKTSSTKDVDNSSGKSQGDGEASCSMAGVVEPTVSLAPETGEDFQAVAAAVHANPMAVLHDIGCSHHLMGTKAVFVVMAPSDGVKHVRGFNGALQPVESRGTVALQGEAGKRVLIPNVLYVPGVQTSLLSAGQLKESGVQLKGDGDEMLLITATRGVFG
ncbi:unnamed protein product [Closterium sp. NIES-54]